VQATGDAQHGRAAEPPVLVKRIRHGQAGISRLVALIPPQKQMTGMLGHPVAENPIDRMFDAVYAHYGLPWQFWKNDIATEADLALAVRALVPLGYRGT
jgi:hypothetical protein